MALMTVEDLANSVVNFKEWEDFWFLIVKQVSKSWVIPDESDFYPNIKTAQCVQCQKECRNYKQVMEIFGFKWNGQKGQYLVHEKCMECR